MREFGTDLSIFKSSQHLAGLLEGRVVSLLVATLLNVKSAEISEIKIHYLPALHTKRDMQKQSFSAVLRKTHFYQIEHVSFMW